MAELTHFNEQGRAKMVDVTDKAVSRWETGRGLPDENPWALGLA